MQIILGFICVASLAFGAESWAKTLTVENGSNRTFEVTLVPNDILSMTPKERERAVKDRFAIIKPGESARLNLDQISSIYVKNERHPDKGRIWFIYDQSSALELFEELRTSKRGAQFIIKGNGGSFEIRVGNISKSGKITTKSWVY